MATRRRLFGIAVPAACLSIFAVFAGQGPASIYAVLVLSPLLVILLSVAIARDGRSRVTQIFYATAALVAGAQLAAVTIYTISDDPGDTGIVVVPLALAVLNTIVSLGGLVAQLAESTPSARP